MRRLTLLVAVVLVPALGALASAQQPPPSADQGDQYAWAQACKSCHAPIFDAWSKTKHAKTFNRITPADREGDKCIGCHVTGPRQALAGNVNAGVQCESCHGAAKAHAESAAAGTVNKAGLTKKPGESVCAQCHNDKSPHYRGFFYGAMTGLVHKVQ